MDKIIEDTEFTGVVSRIRHAAFVTGEESGCSGLKAEVDFGSYHSNANESRSSHTMSLNDFLLLFAIMDHASFMGLGHLDMEGMCQLCILDAVDEIPDDILIDGVVGDGDDDGNNGGGGNGDDGGAGGVEILLWW